jgi:hypothetical protein
MTRSRFYLGMAAAMSVVVFVGFAPSFYLRAYFGPLPNVPPLSSPLVYIHGFVFSGWMILLLVQTGLTTTGNVRWHRRAGMAGAVLAALVVIVGVMAQFAQTHRMIVTGELDRSPAAMSGLFLSAMLGMGVFGALTGIALYLRRNGETHKRLMMLATLVLLGAASARIGGLLASALPAWAPVTPYVSSVILLAFVFALLTHDLQTRKRVHSVTVWGGLTIVALHISVQLLTLTPFAGQPAVVEIVRRLAS